MEKVGFYLGLRKIGGIYKSGVEGDHFWQKSKYTYWEKKYSSY